MATTESRMKQLTGAYADLNKSNMLVGEMAVPSDHVPVVRNGVNSWEDLLTSQSAGDIIELSETMTEQIESFEQLVIDKVGINDSTATLTQAYSGSKTQGLIDGVNTNLSAKANQSSLDATNASVAQKADKSEVTNVMTPKGNIAYASLPMTGNTVGWYYYCPDGDGTNGAGNYAWNGTVWYFAGTGDQGYSILKSEISKIIIKGLSWSEHSIVQNDGIINVQQNYNTSNFIKAYGEEVIEQSDIIIDGVKFFCRIAEYDKTYNFIKINDDLYTLGKATLSTNTNFIKFSFGKPDGSYIMTPIVANTNFIANIYNMGNRIMRESYSSTICNTEFIDAIGYAQKAMYDNGEYTPDDFNTSVVVIDKYTGGKKSLEIGQKYRISIAVGYVVILFWGNGKRDIVDTQLFDFVADSDKLSLQIVRLDGQNISVSQAEEFCDLKITKVEKKNRSTEYDYIVAPYNASYEDKAKADLICDGINDEVEINCAVNGCISEKGGCKVLLLSGDYNIGAFHCVFPSIRGDFTFENSTIYKSAICIQRSWLNTNYYNGYYTADISGVEVPNSRHSKHTAKIHLSEELINTLDINQEYCIFSFAKYGIEHMGSIDWYNFAVYRKLFIDVHNASKKIIAVDATSSHGLAVEDCMIYANYYLRENDMFRLDTAPMVLGSCGIRGDEGGDNGMGQSYVKSCVVYGFYEGIAITGEHFVIENCLQHSCHYGFTIGNYNVVPDMQHPITFIGNSVEQCYQMALFNRYGATEESTAPYAYQTVIYIGGSTECRWKNSSGSTTEMLPIKEVVRGAYRGRIESDWSISYPTIFENGSGTHFKQTLYDGSGLKYSN